MRLARRLVLLLAQVVQRREHLCRGTRPRRPRCRRRTDVGGEQADHGAHLEPAFGDQLLQHRSRVGIELARRLADHRVVEDVRELAGELPGLEERRPVDVRRPARRADSPRTPARPSTPRRDRRDRSAQSILRRLARASASDSSRLTLRLAGVLLARPRRSPRSRCATKAGFAPAVTSDWHDADRARGVLHIHHRHRRTAARSSPRCARARWWRRRSAAAR